MRFNSRCLIVLISLGNCADFNFSFNYITKNKCLKVNYFKCYKRVTFILHEDIILCTFSSLSQLLNSIEVLATNCHYEN